MRAARKGEPLQTERWIMDFIQPPHAFVQKRAVANGAEAHANWLLRAACVQGESLQGGGISQGFK